MAPLKNPRHERFCQAIATIGKSHRMAYIDAGYKSTLDSADASAARLLADAKVAARVSELQVEAAKETIATAARVLEEMAKLAFANMADFFMVGTDGAPRLDWGSLTRDQKAALQEVTCDIFTDGRGDDAREVRRVKFRLADKRAVLVDLGRHLGLFKEKVEHSGPGGGPVAIKDVTPRSDLDAARRIAWLLNCAATPLPEKGKTDG
jgi:phage terminase small subunit